MSGPSVSRDAISSTEIAHPWKKGVSKKKNARHASMGHAQGITRRVPFAMSGTGQGCTSFLVASTLVGCMHYAMSAS
eukprot:236662-Rhodomonas_salina.3